MKNIIRKFTLLAASLGLVSLFVLAPSVGAVNITKQGSEDTSVLKNSGGNASFTDIMKNVISTLLFVLGIAAVIAIIIGGIMFATANGDQGAIKKARNTVLYSGIGLIVAIMAYAIVNFVLEAFA